MPNVTQRLRVRSASYGEGVIDISVVQELVTDDGQVLNASAITEHVHVPEADGIAAGVANGRTDGEWGNREVVQLVTNATRMVSPEIPEVPAVPALLDNAKNVLRAEIPGRPAVPAVYVPRFTVSTITW